MAATDFANIALVTIGASETAWTLPSNNIHSMTIIPDSTGSGPWELAIASAGTHIQIPSTGLTINDRNLLKNAVTFWFDGTNTETIRILYFLGSGR